MKTNFVLSILLVLISAPHSWAQDLMPLPASITFNKDRLAIDESFKVGIRGHSDARLQAAVARFVTRLEGRTVYSFAPRLALDDDRSLRRSGSGQRRTLTQRKRELPDRHHRSASVVKCTHCRRRDPRTRNRAATAQQRSPWFLSAGRENSGPATFPLARFTDRR